MQNKQLTKGLFFIEKAAPKCIEAACSVFLANPPAVLLAGYHNMNVGRNLNVHLTLSIYAAIIFISFKALQSMYKALIFDLK